MTGFNFGPVAEHLARAIREQPTKDGLVIGIEGKWGSGKSSLINLTIEALKREPEGPAVVAFSPWLVGDRNELLRGLFDELAAVAVTIDPIESAIAEIDTPQGFWKASSVNAMINIGSSRKSTG